MEVRPGNGNTPSPIIGGIARVARQLAFRWWRVRGIVKLAFLRLAYPSAHFGRGILIDPSARISVTDGGALTIGAGTEIGANAMIAAQGGVITIGANSYIGVGAIIIAKQSLEIGEDALLSQYVSIRDHDHRFDDGALPYRQQGFTVQPVSIGRNVWLGAKVSVMRGITIGDNSVVGANAVVTHDVARDTVSVGVPARPVRTLP